MKKFILFIIFVGMFLSLTSCNNKKENITVPKQNISSETSVKGTTFNEWQQEMADLSKTMNKTELNNVTTTMSVKQQKEVQAILHIEKWEKQEIPQRGFTKNCKLIADSKKEICFADGNGVMIYNSDKKIVDYYVVPMEVINKLVKLVEKITNDGIKRGNEVLNNKIYEFKDLIICQPSKLYDIQDNEVYKFSTKELQQLHSLLEVEKWKLYIGDYSTIYNDENVPFTLHKKDEQDMGLQFKQYSDLYVAKIQPYDGPNGEDCAFIIPKEVYSNLVNFKKEIEAKITTK